MKISRIMGIGAITVALNGCAVGMAMSGKSPPAVSELKASAQRSEIEMQVGEPVKTATLADGKRVDTYEYTIGDEPSAGRAIGHAVLDLLTWGIWEAVGTPIEMAQGEKYQMTVTYDKNDRAVSVKSQKIKSAGI